MRSIAFKQIIIWPLKQRILKMQALTILNVDLIRNMLQQMRNKWSNELDQFHESEMNSTKILAEENTMVISYFAILVYVMDNNGLTTDAS